MLVDRGGFWYRVLTARYGEEAVRLEVARIKNGIGDGGEGQFAERVSRKVGDGADTSFWYDRWLGGVPLCQRFSRLFDLAENKSISVPFCSLQDGRKGVRRGSGGGGCGCGRRWQRSVGSCYLMLLCSLMFQIPGNGIPTLRGAIRLLQVTKCSLLRNPLSWTLQIT